jgi:hypothetical protein
MVRHVVMFKLTEFASPAEKQARMEQIKIGLEALAGRIDVVRSIHVGLNINPSEEWDVMLTAEFDSLEDLPAYSNHPEHIAVLSALIAPVKAARACVDCEIWN